MPRGGREGRLTLGLYNSYDKTRFAEAHRRALARAGAVAAAFECNLVTFGFPFDKLVEEAQGSTKSGKNGGEAAADAAASVDVRDPRTVARYVADSTTIGAGGQYFVELAEQGRFHVEDLPPKGFPPQYGTPVLATSRIEAAGTDPGLRLAERLVHGEGLLLVIGLGPHGFPKALQKVVKDAWDLTGRALSLETCTAMSAAPAILHTHLTHLRRSRGQLPDGEAGGP